MFWRLNMSTCPHCGCTRPSVDQKLRELFAARVGMPARLNRRSDAASTNELATEVEAIEAEPIVKLGQGDFERAWGGVSGRVVRHGGGA